MAKFKLVDCLPAKAIQDAEVKRIFSDEEKVYVRNWIIGSPGKFECREFDNFSDAKEFVDNLPYEIESRRIKAERNQKLKKVKI
jgi:hypothetical protein